MFGVAQKRNWVSRSAGLFKKFFVIIFFYKNSILNTEAKSSQI